MSLRNIVPSKYAKTPRYIIEDKNGRSIIIGFRRTYYQYEIPRMRKHLVKQGETMVSLALMYYNTPELWYTIADANQGVVYPLDLVAGTEIYIPPLEVARDEI